MQPVLSDATWSSSLVKQLGKAAWLIDLVELVPSQK